jgi:hypothetical protein
MPCGRRTTEGHPMYRKIGSVAPVALALVLAAPAAAAVAAPAPEYTMNLSRSAATVQAGGLATTLITFTRTRHEPESTRVALSATGLPAGVTAHFLPAKPFLIGHSSMFLTTSPGTPAGTATITISAITLSSDPIGTTAPFTLTVTGG